MNMAKKPLEASEFPKRIRVFVMLIAGMFVFGTIAFTLLKGIPPAEAFIRTAESLAFIFQEQVWPGKALEIFLSLFGVFAIWWVLWSFFDMLIEGKLGEYIKVRKFLNKMRRMENHYIIAGGGRVGEELAKNLAKKGEKCIIIEKDSGVVSRLKRRELLVLQGDAHDESLLKEAGIMAAKAMIITLPDPEKALVATMIAKELNEKLDVFVRCENPSFINKLKKAGAKSVVVPEAVAAEKLMGEIAKA
ncbi:MAG: hypothetical protein FJY76_01935 [Candidatus Aenigmarchaeota archaeon]|nr:hypothetical protein [Candidatus Aenigmarchaeota archaeon]